MPLLINGVVEDLPHDTRSIFHGYPQYKESASALCALPPKVVGPVGLLYVCQREYAVTVPHDKNVTVIGSDDATTCHIAVLRHSASGAVGFAHFDGAGCDEGVAIIVRRIQELSLGYPDGRLELHLVGGFQDNRGCSEELSVSLLHGFHKQQAQIELLTLCVGELNSTIRGGIHWPIIYGLGINVKTGEIFPATFSEKGPDVPLRSARHLTGPREMIDIYDCSLELLRIGPFNYEPLRSVNLWLQQSDDFILQNLSTSPEVEPPHFVMSLRTTLKFIQENPFPSVTVFPDNRAHYYRKDTNGDWIPVHY